MLCSTTSDRKSAFAFRTNHFNLFCRDIVSATAGEWKKAEIALDAPHAAMADSAADLRVRVNNMGLVLKYDATKDIYNNVEGVEAANLVAMEADGKTIWCVLFLCHALNYVSQAGRLRQTIQVSVIRHAASIVVAENGLFIGKTARLGAPSSSLIVPTSSSPLPPPVPSWLLSSSNTTTCRRTTRDKCITSSRSAKITTQSTSSTRVAPTWAGAWFIPLRIPSRRHSMAPSSSLPISEAARLS